MPKKLPMKGKKLGGSPVLSKGQRNWNGGFRGVAAVILGAIRLTKQADGAGGE
jgi:hypothetical protein